MEWLIFTSQLPASPSSLRVMVWRKMKAMGAVSLQNGVWVLPRAKEQEQMVQELLKYLEEQRAEGQSFAATALGEKVENDILKRFRVQRDEEYTELIERCDGLLAELEKETKRKKFTFAELEENEDDLQKLESWLKRIQIRDLVGGARAAEAVHLVESCKKALEVFAEHVYSQEQITSEAHLSK
jgi:hypothetical protein